MNSTHHFHDVSYNPPQCSPIINALNECKNHFINCNIDFTSTNSSYTPEHFTFVTAVFPLENLGALVSNSKCPARARGSNFTEHINLESISLS